MDSDKDHQLDDADHIIDEALAIAGKHAYLYVGIILTMARNLIRMGKLETAKKSLHEAFVIACETDRDRLIYFTQMFAEAGDLDAAKKAADVVFAAAREEPESGRRTIDWAGVVEVMLVVGKINEALAAVRMIEDTFSQPYTYVAIIEAVKPFEDQAAVKAVIDEGLAALRKMTPLAAQGYHTMRFAVALARLGKTEEAKTVFDEASFITRKIEDATARAWGLLRIIEALGKDERLDEAIPLLDELSGLVGEAEYSRNLPERIIDLAQAQARFGRMAQAERVLTEGVAVLRKLTDPEAQANGLISLAGAMSRFGLEAETIKALDEALAAVQRMDSSHGMEIIITFTILMARIRLLTNVGKIEQALAMAHACEKPQDKIGAFKMIATAMSNAGRIEEAKSLIEETLALTRKTEYPSYAYFCPTVDDQFWTLISLARMLVEIGKIEEAGMVALEAQALSPKGYSAEDEVRGLIAVAEILNGTISSAYCRR
ncbi:MAG: hypothetical protein V7641_4541 [Blastocatellia bacterium]